jgi:hypothetical protein
MAKVDGCEIADKYKTEFLRVIFPSIFPINTIIFPGQKQLLLNFWKIMATLKSHTCKVLYLDLPLFNPEAESNDKHG